MAILAVSKQETRLCSFHLLLPIIKVLLFSSWFYWTVNTSVINLVLEFNFEYNQCTACIE